MSGRDGEQRRDDGWLGYDRPEQDGADARAAQGEQAGNPAGADDATGPWLRHDLDQAPRDGSGPDGADGPDAGSPWLEPELTVPGDRPARPEAAAGTGAMPSHTQPVRVTDTDPDATGAGHDDGPTGPSRRQRHDEQAEEPVGGLAVVGAAVKEFAIVVGMALVLSFVVKTWLLQAFYIPSGSMEDTLRVNDRVIVSKLTPGPFDLRRGDIIVFGDPGNWVDAPVQQQHGTVMTAVRDTMMFVGLLPDDAENHLIKRVIGLPGDHVVCCDAGGRLTVNGAPVKEPYLKPGVAPSDQNFDITVPRGRVWVMGDNRSGSSDSRFHDAPTDDGSLGSVDERLIVGRAVALVWPLDHLRWLSNPSATFRNVPAPAAGAGSGSNGTSGSEPGGTPTTGGGTVDGGAGG